MMTVVTVDLPEAIVEIFGAPRGSYMYRVARGGRGSGKSVGAATVARIWGSIENITVLCTRQFQNSIADSFYKELLAALDLHPWLKQHYRVTKETITGHNI